MATNLALDDKLIAEAVKLGKHKTKREAVTTALKEYIRIKHLDGWDDLVGKVDYYDDLPKKSQSRRRTG
jgi:Arc/MetJ family transcription regulator